MTTKKQKKDQENKDNCIQVHELTYSWFMPELVLAAHWAKEDWLIRLLGTSLTTEEKIRGMHEALFETDNPSQKELFMFETIMNGIFVGDPQSDRNLKHFLHKWFPQIKELERMLEMERPDTLITGTPMIGNNWDLKDYIRATLWDIIDGHVRDMNTVMGEHYDGGVDMFIGSTFQLVTSEDVLRCELENLVYTGSTFNCGGTKIRMLPILIG
jgi:hypothetical protein